MMRAIKSKDTKPELAVRRVLHAMGYRFRLHTEDLPGRPDIVFRARKKAIFVHGCFWHRHPGCRYSTMPKTRTSFWEKKFEANVTRDRRVIESLVAEGWRVLVVWECQVRNEMDTLPATLVSFMENTF